MSKGVLESIVSRLRVRKKKRGRATEWGGGELSSAPLPQRFPCLSLGLIDSFRFDLLDLQYKSDNFEAARSLVSPN